MLCLRFKSVEATRLVHVEISTVLTSPKPRSSSWFSEMSAYRTLCVTLATIDIAYTTTSCPDERSETSVVSNEHVIDYDDEDEDEETSSKQVRTWK